jgi:hypothetical protein
MEATSAMINEHDRVVLTTTMPGEGLEAGDVGTVVHVSRDGLAFEVELTTLGKTAAVVTQEAAQVPTHGQSRDYARSLN